MARVGRSASGGAHDLNDVLTVIPGGCDVILMDGGSDLKRGDFQEVRKATRATSLTGRKRLRHCAEQRHSFWSRTRLRCAPSRVRLSPLRILGARSGRCFADDRVSLVQEQSDSFVQKPFGPERLAPKVREALR